MTRGDAPPRADGRPMVGPFDRAGWRAWLIANHASVEAACTSCRGGAVPGGRACPTRRRSRRRCASAGSTRAAGRSTRSGRSSGSRRDGRERLGAIEQGARGATHGGRADAARGSRGDRGGEAVGLWTLLDDVEKLIVPDDLAAALGDRPPARERWDAFPPSARRAMLEWVVEAKRPETRAKRIAAIAEGAERDERAYPPGLGRPGPLVHRAQDALAAGHRRDPGGLRGSAPCTGRRRSWSPVEEGQPADLLRDALALEDAVRDPASPSRARTRDGRARTPARRTRNTRRSCRIGRS